MKKIRKLPFAAIYDIDNDHLLMTAKTCCEKADGELDKFPYKIDGANNTLTW